MAVETQHAPRFHEAMDSVDSLPPEDQALLVEIVNNRLREYRRSQLVREVAEARHEYQRGEVRRGSATDLLAEIDQ